MSGKSSDRESSLSRIASRTRGFSGGSGSGSRGFMNGSAAPRSGMFRRATSR